MIYLYISIINNQNVGIPAPGYQPVPSYLLRGPFTYYFPRAIRPNRQKL